MCPRGGECGHVVENVARVSGECARGVEQCARGVDNVLAGKTMCARCGQYARGVVNVRAGWGMCARCESCARGVENVRARLGNVRARLGNVRARYKCQVIHCTIMSVLKMGQVQFRSKLLIMRIFSNHGEQFKGIFSNL